MKKYILLLIILLNIHAMKAQKHSESTTYSQTHSSTTTIESDKVSTTQTMTLSATYESDFNPENFKNIVSIIKDKLGKSTHKSEGFRIWENAKEKNDAYKIVIKQNNILIDYTGMKLESKKRDVILKLIEKVKKIVRQ